MIKKQLIIVNNEERIGQELRRSKARIRKELSNNQKRTRQERKPLCKNKERTGPVGNIVLLSYNLEK